MSFKIFRKKITKGGSQNFLDYFIYRKISVLFTWAFVRTSMSANQATLAQIYLGLLGFISFLLLRPFIGLLLFHLSYIFDCVDGEIARFRKQVSAKGDYLDEIAHIMVIPLLWVGFGCYLYSLYGNVLLFVLCALNSLFSRDILFLVASLCLVRNGKEVTFNKRHEKINATENYTLRSEGLNALFVFPQTLSLITVTILVDLFVKKASLYFIVTFSALFFAKLFAAIYRMLKNNNMFEHFQFRE